MHTTPVIPLANEALIGYWFKLSELVKLCNEPCCKIFFLYEEGGGGGGGGREMKVKGGGWCGDISTV